MEITLVPEDSSSTRTVLALVLPGDAYNTEVPVVIGTNLIHLYRQECEKSLTKTPIDPVWQIAFRSCSTSPVSDGVIGCVKSTREEVIPAGQKQFIRGIGRMTNLTGSGLEVLPEAMPQHALPGGLIITPTLLRIPGQSASTHRISVEVVNVSKQSIRIPAKIPICALHQVTLEPTDEAPGFLSSSTTSPQFLDKFNWPENPHYSHELQKLILDWKEVFSQHDLDYGRTDKIKHKINLKDDTPIKIPHRRVPPSMVAEVREHLKDMISGNHIRPSTSPLSWQGKTMDPSDSASTIGT